jgi:hypothetical protein
MNDTTIVFSGKENESSSSERCGALTHIIIIITRESKNLNKHPENQTDGKEKKFS